MSERGKTVYGYTQHRLRRLGELPDNTRRAVLAELRRGVGHIPGDIPALWGMFLDEMPEELLKDIDNTRRYTPGVYSPTEAEWAVYIALTMFALHQQGHDPGTEFMHKEGERLGIAARWLAPTSDDSDEELKRVRARFGRISTSSDMRELSNHLRGMINLMSGKGIRLDYADLAADLYEYAFPERRAGVRLKWGEDFSRLPKNKTSDNNEN